MINIKIFKNDLKKVIDYVYIFLLSVIKSNSNNSNNNIDNEKIKLSFKALSSWLKYKLPVTANILLCTFQISFDICLHQEQFLDCLAPVLEGSAVCLHQRVTNEYTEAYNYAMERSLHSLASVFKKYAQDQEDDTKAIPIINVFIQFLISDEQELFSKETISRCLEMILSFISIANREVCSMTFNLLDDYKSHPTLVSLEPEKAKWFFLTLLDRFKDLSMYPLDYIDDENDTQQQDANNGLDEDIACFRSLASGCFSFAERNKVVEKTMFHHYLVNQLGQKIGQGVMVWQVYESILYYLCSLSESSNEAQSEFVPILLKLIPSIPAPKTTPLIRSSIGLVGKYSFFLKDKSFYLEKVIFDLLPAFNCKPLIGTAAESFSSICINNECATILFTHINRIIELCQPVLFGCKVQSNPVVIKIYKALFYIIQSAKTIQEFTPPFQQLVTPIIHNLTQFVNSNNNNNNNNNNNHNVNNNNHSNKFNISNQDKPILLIQLEILASISQMIEFDEFENTTHSDAPYQYFKTIVPLLGKILSMYNLDFEALNNIVVIYRWPILFTKNIVFDFLEEILCQMTQSYLQYPFSPLLQVISAMISLTNLSENIEKQLEYSISNISTLTINQFPKVQQHQQNIDMPLIDFSTQPDATKDYLFLIMHTLKSRPQCVNRNIVSTLCVSIIYYLLDTKDINTTKNCCNFLYGVLSLPTTADIPKCRQLLTPIVDELLSVHRGTLINNLIHGLFSGIISSISLTQFYSDILYALCNLNEKQFKLDISHIIMNANTFLPNLHPSERQNFISELTPKVHMTEYRSKVRKLVLLSNASKIN